MQQALSNTDIQQLLDGKTRVLKYEDLSHFDTVEDLLAPYGNAVILYPAKSTVDGHWTCLFYSVSPYGKRVVEFFDPYGYSPDKEFSQTTVKLPRFLARLLIKTPYQVEYNNHRLQRMSKNINTCGRHCVNRILNADMDIDTYKKVFGTKDGITGDELVTFITDNL